MTMNRSANFAKNIIFIKLMTKDFSKWLENSLRNIKGAFFFILKYTYMNYISFHFLKKEYKLNINIHS